MSVSASKVAGTRAAPKSMSPRQAIRILFLQVQRAQSDPVLVDFHDFRAHARRADMSDLDFTIESLARVQLATEFENLPYLERFAAPYQEAMVAHVHKRARKRVGSGFQRRFLADSKAAFALLHSGTPLEPLDESGGFQQKPRTSAAPALEATQRACQS